ncbi:MarR family winged helix-turn-helix transcriptional regulator [Streptomyces albus]|uniref:MarR family winged helix-turn-helix transcriptional regulator n=1 Tax=Streptomyces albus TaxID=1888 RepID=UPI003F1CC65F
MDVVAYLPAGVGRLAVEGAPEPLGGEAEDPGGHAAERVELVYVGARLLRRADAFEGGGRLVGRGQLVGLGARAPGSPCPGPRSRRRPCRGGAAPLGGVPPGPCRLPARRRGRAVAWTRHPHPGALSPTHVRALRVLAEQGPLGVRRLAVGTKTSGAATARPVSGLVAAGYVTRIRGFEDNGSVPVALTDAGRARHDERRLALTEALHTAPARLGAPAVDSAAEVLDHLSAVHDRI